MKHNQAFLFLLLTLSLTLWADDFRWVNSSFKWKGTGTVCTQVFPIFGEYFRVSYSSPKGSLKITLVDASKDHKPLADKVVVESIHQTLPDRKEYSGRSKAYLVIEGGSQEWQVTVDQYLDTIQEWSLKNYIESQAALPAPKKVAVWASEGASKIDYTPKGNPWRIKANSDNGEPVRVTVSTTGEKPRVLFRGILRKDSPASAGWINYKEPVVITVECAAEAAWGIEALLP